jgi:hypothetical protein
MNIPEEISTKLEDLVSRVVPPAVKLIFDLPSHDPDENRLDIRYFQTRMRLFINIDSRFRDISGAAIEVSNSLVSLADSQSDYSDAMSPESDQLIEALTLAWLVLFFLGIPFIHPWEVVLRLIERTGFPRGSSICKACGDLYRQARKGLALKSSTASASPVYFLDHNPLALDRLRAVKKEKGFKHKSAILGACYELLQLRLYVLEHGAIKHFVFEDYLQMRLLNPATRPAMIESLWRMIQLVYGGNSTNHSTAAVRVIESDDDVQHMPGCVLSGQNGVFRTRSRHSDLKNENILIAPSGNYIGTRQVVQYRNRLDDRRDDGVSVSQMKKHEFTNYCESILKKAHIVL